MPDYEVVVCGAGPAGATAARFLARSGHTTLLLDKDAFPRDKTCGGALRPQVVEDFDYVGSAIKKIPHVKCTKAVMHSPSLKYAVPWEPEGHPVLYSAHRKDFDDLLVKHAVDAGAELRENVRVRKVSVTVDSATVELEGSRTVSADMVIGACGAQGPVSSYLRKREGLPPRWPHSHIGLVLAKEFEVGEDFVEGAYGKERAHHFHLKPRDIYGYGWAFSKLDHINVGFGAYWADMKKIDVQAVFNEYIGVLKASGLFPKDLDPGRARGAMLPLRGPIERSYTDRVLLIGDAAGFVSPIAGDGIHYAMVSARLASKTAASALSRGSFGKEALRPYEDSWRSLWRGEFSTLVYFADKLSADPERLIRFASLDPVLRENFAKAMVGFVNPAEIKGKMVRRIIRDMLFYDVLKRKV